MSKYYMGVVNHILMGHWKKEEKNYLWCIKSEREKLVILMGFYVFCIFLYDFCDNEETR